MDDTMFKKIEDLNFYELLEISPRASAQEIHRAYERVRRVYDPNSIALYSLFTPEETAAIHQRIEEAYRTLLYEDNRRKYDEELRNSGEMQAPPVQQQRSLRTQASPAGPSLSSPGSSRTTDMPQPAADPVPQEIPAPAPFNSDFTGPAIKLLREQRNLTLRQVSDITKIGLRYLELIEEEQFQKLPARAYLRGFLMQYAKILGYDPERVAGDYLKRYEASMNQPKK